MAGPCRGAVCISLDTPSTANLRLAKDAAEAHLAAQLSWLRHNASLLRELTCTYKWVKGWKPMPSRPLRWDEGDELPTYGQALPSVLPLLRAALGLHKLCASVDLSAFNNSAAVRKTASSLAALSSLVQLSLTIESGEATGGPGALLSGLQALSQLTHCSLVVEGSGPGFLHMGKAGLQQLQIPASLMSVSLLVRLRLHSADLELSMSEMGECELFAMALDSHAGIDETTDWGRPYPSAQQPALLLGHLTSLKVGWQAAIRQRQQQPSAGSYSDVSRGCRPSVVVKLQLVVVNQIALLMSEKVQSQGAWNAA